MQLNIEFPKNIESTLRRRAAAAGLDVATYVSNIVVEELSDDESAISPPSPRTPEELIAKLREMIQRHEIRNGHVDDSRESIYAGCGE